MRQVFPKHSYFLTTIQTQKTVTTRPCQGLG